MMKAEIYIFDIQRESGWTSNVCPHQGRRFSNQSGLHPSIQVWKQQLIKWSRPYRVKLSSGLWLRRGCECACPDPPPTLPLSPTPPFTWGLFFWSGTRDGFPLQKQRRGPFCPSGDPRPIISTDYRWPVWQPYWLRERLFHPVPPSPLLSIENGNIQPFRIHALKKDWKKRNPPTPKRGRNPRPICVLSPCFLSPPQYTFGFSVCSNWKSLLCVAEVTEA